MSEPIPTTVEVILDVNNQTLTLTYGDDTEVVDFNPNPTWPSATEIDQMVGHAFLKVMGALDE